ncbi:MAG: hypothetical protein DLM59_04530 [Pseudonocardiales bacterium]|nr:MAG: hypothetical protein DLM59_04530 [Pseudonocardiales bacterium]
MDPRTPGRRAPSRRDPDAAHRRWLRPGSRAFVISDEIHAPLRYGVAFTPYAEIDERTRHHSVTLFGASKAWNIPGLCLGFIAVTNPTLHAAWATLPDAATAGISPLGIAASAAAFQDGKAWLAITLEYLTDQRATLGRIFDGAGVHDIWTPPQGTYLAWLDPSGQDTRIPPSRCSTAIGSRPNRVPGTGAAVKALCDSTLPPNPTSSSKPPTASSASSPTVLPGCAVRRSPCRGGPGSLRTKQRGGDAAVGRCTQSAAEPRIWKNSRPTAVAVSMPWSMTTRSTPRVRRSLDSSMRCSRERPSRSSLVMTS